MVKETAKLRQEDALPPQRDQFQEGIFSNFSRIRSRRPLQQKIRRRGAKKKRAIHLPWKASSYTNLRSCPLRKQQHTTCDFNTTDIPLVKVMFQKKKEKVRWTEKLKLRLTTELKAQWTGSLKARWSTTRSMKKDFIRIPAVMLVVDSLNECHL